MSLFVDANVLYVTNNAVLIIIFMIVRMIDRYSPLTNCFQDVTKGNERNKKRFKSRDEYNEPAKKSKK